MIDTSVWEVNDSEWVAERQRFWDEVVFPQLQHRLHLRFDGSDYSDELRDVIREKFISSAEDFFWGRRVHYTVPTSAITVPPEKWTRADAPPFPNPEPDFRLKYLMLPSPTESNLLAIFGDCREKGRLSPDIKLGTLADILSREFMPWVAEGWLDPAFPDIYIRSFFSGDYEEVCERFGLRKEDDRALAAFIGSLTVYAVNKERYNFLETNWRAYLDMGISALKYIESDDSSVVPIIFENINDMARGEMQWVKDDPQRHECFVTLVDQLKKNATLFPQHIRAFLLDMPDP